MLKKELLLRMAFVFVLTGLVLMLVLAFAPVVHADYYEFNVTVVVPTPDTTAGDEDKAIKDLETDRQASYDQIEKEDKARDKRNSLWGF